MKKLISLLCIFCMLCTGVSAFTFPEPDWGALLREKTEMVSETDFELFVEGPQEAAPYFGAKLEPKAGAYFGMIAETSDFLSPVSSYLTYISVDDRQTDFYYPANEMIRKSNAVVTVGFTVNSLNNVDYTYIKNTLDTLAKYQKPMFIRFANEMNVSPIGDDPGRYIEVFRRVADMVHSYKNFAVVWSPNDLGGLDRPFDYYYPGDAYVDWVGVSSYMKMYFAGNRNTAEKDSIYFMTGDYAWATNALKPIIQFMEENNIKKPVMLSECGVSTETVFGDDCSGFAKPRLRNLYYNVLMKYPQVKLINYFNTYRANEKEKYSVHDPIHPQSTDQEYAKSILKEAAEFGAYLDSYGDTPEFVLAKANAGHTLTAKNGAVTLYTLAHVPKQPALSVNYYVDGVWTAAPNEAPYRFSLPISTLSNGAHTVKIASYGMEKEYTFYKNGNRIRFGQPPEEEPIKILVNGRSIPFDAPPVIKNGRTLVPVRAIFEALDCQVDWDGDTRTALAKGRGKTISITIDKMTFTKNNEEIPLDVPAQIIQNRTFVPARAVAEALDCFVDWDGDTRTVIIKG